MLGGGRAEIADVFVWSPGGKIHISEQHDVECGFALGGMCVRGLRACACGPEGGACVCVRACLV